MTVVLNAGDLRRRITFQQRDSTQDSVGQQVTTWTDVVTVWGRIESLSAREIIAAQSVHSEVTHKIKVRYRSEFSNPLSVAAMRVIYGGRVFNVSGAMNVDEANQVIEMMASEGLNNG